MYALPSTSNSSSIPIECSSVLCGFISIFFKLYWISHILSSETFGISINPITGIFASTLFIVFSSVKYIIFTTDSAFTNILL